MFQSWLHQATQVCQRKITRYTHRHMKIMPWIVYNQRLSIPSNGRVALPSAFADLVRVCHSYDAFEIAEIFLAPPDDGEIDASQDSLKLTAQHLCEQFISGHIATFARQIHGGAVLPMHEDHWEIDNPLPRVATGALNFERWADPNAPLTHRIFLDSRAFDQWLVIQEPYGPLTDSQIGEILDPRLRATRNAGQNAVSNQSGQILTRAGPLTDEVLLGIGRDMLTIAEVCHLTTRRKSTIYSLVKADKFPKYFKLGTSTRWWRDEILAWIKEQSMNRGI
jgi:predicted DNA-binding transcriptional regulator AlpA